MTPEFVDTHCHLTLSEFSQDLDLVIQRAEQAGVTRIVVPGIDLETSQLAVRLAEGMPGTYAAVGVHPHHAEEWSSQAENQFRHLASSAAVCAIGEIGLDFYRKLAEPERQRAAFQAQLELAADLSLPVLVHNRQATDEILQLLIEWAGRLGHPLKGRPGVLHAFSADLTAAREAAAAGFFLGVAGPITYKNAQERREITRELPLDRIVIETDSPYLTPHPHRGRRNEPAHLRLVAEQLAVLRDLPVEQIAHRTSKSAEQLFGWTNEHQDHHVH